MVVCFKQKTAYEMRISDWSSDGCSSDLVDHRALGDVGGNAGCELVLRQASRCKCHALKPPAAVTVRGTGTTRCTKMPGVTMDSGSSAPSGTTSCTVATVVRAAMEIGRATCRERVCQYV